jgi:hypothetical protein
MLLTFLYLKIDILGYLKGQKWFCGLGKNWCFNKSGHVMVKKIK